MAKILFIRGGAVGDFILTLPAIQLVRELLPDVEIDILGYESISRLAVDSGLADRTQFIEDASLAQFFAPGARLDAETCRYFAEFDIVISYLYDPDGFFSSNLEKAGVETLITGPYKMDESEPFVATPLQLAAPLEQLALFLEKPFVELSYGKTKTHDHPVVAIHPGSGSPSKNWSLEGWVEIASRIHSAHPETRFLIIGGEAETETIGEFLNFLNEKEIPHEQALHLELNELAREIAACDFFPGPRQRSLSSRGLDRDQRVCSFRSNQSGDLGTSPSCLFIFPGTRKTARQSDGGSNLGGPGVCEKDRIA